MSDEQVALMRGTLDMLILQTLEGEAKHGYAVARSIQEATDDVLRVEEGSLYPALYRMERRGWIESEWGQSENNRRARFYRLTAKGRRQLREEADLFERFIEAVRKVMQPA